jgi:hypothetical protein
MQTVRIILIHLESFRIASYTLRDYWRDKISQQGHICFITDRLQYNIVHIKTEIIEPRCNEIGIMDVCIDIEPAIQRIRPVFRPPVGQPGSFTMQRSIDIKKRRSRCRLRL